MYNALKHIPRRDIQVLVLVSVGLAYLSQKHFDVTGISANVSSCFQHQVTSFTMKWCIACNLCPICDICALPLDKLNERNLQGGPLERCYRNVVLPSPEIPQVSLLLKENLVL